MKPTTRNKEILDIHSKKCTPLINDSKNSHLAKMSAKLDNPKTVPKAYVSVINKILSKTVGSFFMVGGLSKNVGHHG